MIARALQLLKATTAIAVYFIFSAQIACANGNTFEMAAGGAAAWSERQQYASRTQSFFAPEALLYAYIPIWENLYARSGTRISYQWEQPDMPSSVRVEERDFSAQAEAGFVWNSAVIPSLSVGVGRIWRNTTLKTDSPIVAVASGISEKTQLNFWIAQFGLGLPILIPSLVVEPFWRYQSASKDWRLRSVFGIEATISFLH